jgi:hypothetical protein
MLTILGIHGVGSHARGSVRSAVAAAASEAGYDAQTDELYWNDEIELESPEDAFLIANGSRTNGAMLSIASSGFIYFKSRMTNITGRMFELFDSAIFATFHVLFFLIPIAVGLMLYNRWFESQSMGSGDFLVYSRPIAHLVLAGASVLGFFSILSGFSVQATNCAHPQQRWAPSFAMAACISARRLGLYMINILWVGIIAPISTLWFRVIFGLATFFLLIGAALMWSGVMRYISAFFISKEILERGPISPTVISNFLWMAGYSALAIIVLIGGFRMVYPIAKVLADICLYLGDDAHRDRLLRALAAIIHDVTRFLDVC